MPLSPLPWCLQPFRCALGAPPGTPKPGAYRLLTALLPSGARSLEGSLQLDVIPDGRHLRVGARQTLALSNGEQEVCEAELVLHADGLRTLVEGAAEGAVVARDTGRSGARWRCQRPPARGRAALAGAWSLLAGPHPAQVGAAVDPRPLAWWEELELLHPGVELRAVEAEVPPLPAGEVAQVWSIAGPTLPPKWLMVDAAGEPLALASHARLYLREAA